MEAWDLALIHDGGPAAQWLDRYWTSCALEPRLLHTPELVRVWVLGDPPFPDGVLVTTTGPGDWRWDLLAEIRRTHPALPVLVVLTGSAASCEAARRQGATVVCQAGGQLALRRACRVFRAHLRPGPSRRI